VFPCGVGVGPAPRSAGHAVGRFQEYGDVVSNRLGSGPLRINAMAVHHPEAVHQVLTGAEHTSGRKTQAFEVLGSARAQGST
jgi:hypothetical protein